MCWLNSLIAYYEITLIQTITYVLTNKNKTRGIKHMTNNVNQFN
jgi:hypothetical protein